MWVAGGLLAAVAVAAGIVAVLLHQAEPFMRARILEELRSRFHARVELDGFHITLDQALFTSEKIQGRIRQLSLRGQGRPKDVKTTDPGSIGSTIQGDFKMAGGVVTLPNLVYAVPGAIIDLKGTYGLDGGTLDFTGKAKMQATVSQMVGGWVGTLLKPADSFFKKDGAGTEVPIRIQGTREQPKFGVDFGRMKSSGAAQPVGQR